MGGGEAEFAGEIAALCERGSEDVWEIWRVAEYEEFRPDHIGRYGRGAYREYAEAWCLGGKPVCGHLDTTFCVLQSALVWR